MFESPTVWAWLWMWYGISPSQDQRQYLQQPTKSTGLLDQMLVPAQMIAGTKRNY